MAKLTVTRGKLAGTEFALEGRNVFDVGSASTTALRLDEPGVSPTHCRLVREDAKFTVFDLGGGIKVNGQKVTHVVLRTGDELVLGPVALKFDGAGSTASTFGQRSPVAASPAPKKAAAAAAPRADASGAADAAGANALVYCLEGPDKGKTWPLVPSREVFSVGRGVNADVVVMDIKASREHCRVVRQGQDGSGYVLVDLGSTNGTKLNGKKVKSSSTTVLQFGDQIKIGNSLLELRASGTATSGPTTRLPPGSTPAPTPPVSRSATTMPTAPAVAAAGSGGFASNSAEPFDVDFDFGNDPAPPTTITDGPLAAPPAPAAPPPAPKTATPQPPTQRQPAPAKAKAPADEEGAEEAAQASLRTFVFDDQPQSFDGGAAAPPPPAKTPAKPKDVPSGNPMRTFVFDDPAFDSPEGAAPPPPPKEAPRSPAKPAAPAADDFSFDADGPTTSLPAPPVPARMKEAQPAPPPPPKKKHLEDESPEAAFRTFVFDDAPAFDADPAPRDPRAFEEPKAAEAPPPPAPKPAPAPPPAPPAAKKKPIDEDESPDAAFRTFVFDETPAFEEPKAAEAPPPPKPAPKPAPAPPPPAPAAKKKPIDEDESPDAAFRTFVFDETPAFEEPKAAEAPPPPKPAPKPAPPPPAPAAKKKPIDEDESPDAAFRTFVFDDAPAFDADPAPRDPRAFEEPKAAEPPPVKGSTQRMEGKGSTGRYDEPAEDEEADEAPDPAVRTFVFDDAPAFEEPGTFKNVDVDVPDLSAKAAPRKKVTPPPPDEDSDEERPAGFQTMLIDADGDSELGEKPAKPASKKDDDDGDGPDIGSHTLVFEEPPPEF